MKIFVAKVLIVVVVGFAEAAASGFNLDSPLRCTPTLNYFCNNIHVSCAGKSTLKTWVFDVVIKDDLARVAASVAASVSVSHKQSAVRQAEVVRAKDHTSILLFFRPTRDYIKVSTTGKFIFRHYTRNGALMTSGWCAAIDA